MQISLQNAKPGMVLSEDVDIAGGVLLQKEEVLDDTLISLLENCGITTIEINETIKQSNVRPASSVMKQADVLNTTNTVDSTDAAETTDTPDTADSQKKIDEPRENTAATEIPPELHITVQPDKMSASIILDPVPQSTATSITAENLHFALITSGIRYGINSRLLEVAAQEWAQGQRHSEFSEVARGTPPVPAIDGDITMLVKHTRSSSECDTIRQLRSFNEVTTSFPHLEITPAGTMIAQQEVCHLSIPGTDVFGKTVPPPALEPGSIIAGENVRLGDDNRSATALCAGIAYCLGSTVGILPVDADGAFTIEISTDHMTARCKVTPPGPGGKIPSKQDLMQLLRDASVHSGVSESDIDTLIALCSRKAFPEEPFTVARGLAPVNGKDGDYLYHFKSETSLAPAINSDGSADYKSINIVTTTTKGQQLVSLIPPTEGHDGSDVFGKVLPAQPGKPAKLPQGPHTVIDPQNSSMLLAGIDGIVRMSGGLVEVCEGFLIRGNVDYSTGNIDYGKTIQVSGDVKAGFTVRAGGDLQVNGTIEDSHITVGGSVLCRCGFLGQGKGTIEAKGDVNISFIKNQSVKSFRSISIAKEAINCFLYSRTSIALHGKPLSAAGGEMHAKNSISVYTVGNHTGIRTLLEVGVDYLMVDELSMIEKQITDTTAHFKSVADTFKRYQQNVGAKKRLSTSEQQKLQELTAAFKQARQQLSVLEERKSIVNGKMYQVDDARITIEHAAYPGTLLKFGERHHFLKEELIGPKTIIYADHEIKIF